MNENQDKTKTFQLAEIQNGDVLAEVQSQIEKFVTNGMFAIKDENAVTRQDKLKETSSYGYYGLSLFFSRFMIVGYKGLLNEKGLMDMAHFRQFMSHLKQHPKGEFITYDLYHNWIRNILFATQHQNSPQDEILNQKKLDQLHINLVQLAKQLGIYESQAKLTESTDKNYQIQNTTLSDWVKTSQQLTEESNLTEKPQSYREFLLREFLLFLVKEFNQSECIFLGSIFSNLLSAKLANNVVTALWQCDIDEKEQEENIEAELMFDEFEKLITKLRQDEALDLKQWFINRNEQGLIGLRSKPSVSLSLNQLYQWLLNQGLNEVEKGRLNAFKIGFMKAHRLEPSKILFEIA